MLSKVFFLKKLLFLLFFFLIFSQCDEKSVSSGDTGTPIETRVEDPGACHFFRTQSLMMDCFGSRGFFLEQDANKKQTIFQLCLKEAFYIIYGQVITPIAPIMRPKQNSSGFNWWFVWGNFQVGNPPVEIMHPIEQNHYFFLDQFKKSIDAQSFSLCLGVENIYTAQNLITASERFILQARIQPMDFIKCYKQQLEVYASKNVCNSPPLSDIL